MKSVDLMRGFSERFMWIKRHRGTLLGLAKVDQVLARDVMRRYLRGMPMRGAAQHHGLGEFLRSSG